MAAVVVCELEWLVLRDGSCSRGGVTYVVNTKVVTVSGSSCGFGSLRITVTIGWPPPSPSLKASGPVRSFDISCGLVSSVKGVSAGIIVAVSGVV